MGYTTDFVGSIGIDPYLNAAEIAYLSAFSDSRRYDRDGDPYAVPGNPLAEKLDHTVDTDIYNTVASAQPGYWCDWVPCLSRCCLTYNGNEKFYSADGWMKYLIEHFLQPAALASRGRRRPQFAKLTFNHRLDGMVVGCRRDTQELFAIEVADNRVGRRVLMEGEPSYDTHAVLPDQEAIDRDEIDRWRRRSNPRTAYGGA